jgi:hypothetical protein
MEQKYMKIGLLVVLGVVTSFLIYYAWESVRTDLKITRV